MVHLCVDTLGKIAGFTAVGTAWHRELCILSPAELLQSSLLSVQSVVWAVSPQSGRWWAVLRSCPGSGPPLHAIASSMYLQDPIKPIIGLKLFEHHAHWDHFLLKMLAALLKTGNVWLWRGSTSRIVSPSGDWALPDVHTDSLANICSLSLSRPLCLLQHHHPGLKGEQRMLSLLPSWGASRKPPNYSDQCGIKPGTKCYSPIHRKPHSKRFCSHQGRPPCWSGD